MIKHLRLQLSQPENSPEKLMVEIRQIRDKLVTLHERSVQIRFVVKPIRHLLEKAAIDWDDFVEECTVSTDSEIQGLLHAWLGSMSNTGQILGDIVSPFN